MTSNAHSYVSDLTAGSGLRSPVRSWIRTDAPQYGLDGDWRFRLRPGLAGLDDSIADPEFDDSAWDLLPVPAHWVLHGDGRYGRPIYTNVQFPFPLDPPYVPDENPTGEYRRRFEAPEWSGAPGRVLLRFDGVESVYRVWLNGAEVGVGKGSRLVQEFDVTALLRPGPNVLAVRVHQWSSMSYVEDQDQWWLPGIFRSVTLLGRPTGSIDDVWVDAGFAAGQGTLRVEVRADAAAYPIRVEIAELATTLTLECPADPAAPAVIGPVEVGAVQPWSAEEPRRYDVTVTSTGEQISLRSGFRTVRIDGDQLLVNDRKVLLHGMNRHETHPVRGRVFDAEHARADMIMMKRHHVNAIRTSHYPPHPQVLELADELGFWVVDECDLETHGFVYADWRGNPSDDPDWRQVYLDRIERTVERDKNHPSVIVWSLGNEAGTGCNLAAMSAWVRARDPQRPVHYEGDHTASYTDLYSRMYPNLKEVAEIGGEHGAILGCTPGEARRVRTKPFLMCEYAHAMGNGPGAIADYERLADELPRLHGGFVWEWRDHGILTHTADGTPYYAYGGDFGEVVHDGNFVMDGMVLPDDSPTPSLAEFAAVAAPVVITPEPDRVTVRNRQHTLSTAGLRLRAFVEHDGVPVLEADLDAPELAPGVSAEVPLPGEVLSAIRAGSPDGEVWLRVQAELAADRAWAPAGHLMGAGQCDCTPPRPASVPRRRPAPTSAAPERVELGGAVFDGHSGELTRLFDLPVAGPRLELWRGPTDNDRSGERGSYELGDPDDGMGDGATGPSSEQRWRLRGLDRLVHRVRSVTADGRALHASVRVGAANCPLVVDVDYHWRLNEERADEVELLVEVVPRNGWDCTWPRVGVRFDLPPAIDRATWFGTGPLESYPDSTAAARVGRFSAGLDDLNVAYSRPQETGHRAGLRDLRLADAEGERLRIRTLPRPDGHRPGFTLTRHTPQQLDAAGHPYELPPPTATYLFIDDAVHGLGSRACGIDVLPQHALWPGARSFEVVLSSARPVGPTLGED